MVWKGVSWVPHGHLVHFGGDYHLSKGFWGVVQPPSKTSFEMAESLPIIRYGGCRPLPKLPHNLRWFGYLPLIGF
jgi:hypothetical protein